MTYFIMVYAAIGIITISFYVFFNTHMGRQILGRE